MRVGPAGDQGSGPASGPEPVAGLIEIARRVGVGGGVPIGEPTEFDPQIAEYIFSSAPTAIRNAQMRKLLESGAKAVDLRALEDLIAHLATVPDEAWAGLRKNEGKIRD